MEVNKILVRSWWQKN